MIQKLAHYLRVYRAFIAMSFAQAMSFRLHFTLVCIMDLLFVATAILPAEILFNSFPSLGPWSREEFMFFVAFMLAVEQLHMTFIGEGFWEMSDDIRTGNLDYKLLRPIGSLFVVVFSHIRAGTFFNFVVPWGFLIYYGGSLSLTPMHWLLLPVLIIAAFALQVMLEILIAIGMFWVIDGTSLNFVRMQLQTISKWPDFLYRSYFRRFFTIIIPILLIGSAPVHFLISTPLTHLILPFIISLLVLPIIISYAWRIGLRKYESASS